MDKLTALSYPPEDPQGPDEICTAIGNMYNDRYAKGKIDTMEGARVEYKYHTHTGNSTNGGGCYTKPHMVGGNSVGGYLYPTPPGQSSINIGCNACQQYVTNFRPEQIPAGQNMQTYLASFVHHNCPASPKRQEGWELNCGKNANTVDEIKLIFD